MSKEKNPAACQSKDSHIECDTEYADKFSVTTIWGGTKRKSTQCLNHAADSERAGRKVELIDWR